MLKEMVIKGGAIVVGILVADVAIEKLEKYSLKRSRRKQDEFEEEVDKVTEEVIGKETH